jgi:superfamily II DNA helicase RecQ
MPRHYFTIPALRPQPAQDELNAFCAAQRVVAVDQQWLADGAASFWAVCVTTADGPGPLPKALKTDRGKPTDRPDYKDVLSEPDFQRYARLRTWRKEAAEQAGVPVYAVFTNEQLAEIVTRRIASMADLKQIDGVGSARVERYGTALLAVLSAWPKELPE